MERAITFIMNFGERGVGVKLKADGSVPATLNPPKGGWKAEDLADYLRQEVRMSNFQDAVRRKGHGSIYLTTEHAEDVLHCRVINNQWFYID